jgi:hypothetical protein
MSKRTQADLIKTKEACEKGAENEFKAAYGDAIHRMITQKEVIKSMNMYISELESDLDEKDRIIQLLQNEREVQKTPVQIDI